MLDIVADAVRWRLPEARWSDVEELMDALHKAVRTGQQDAVEQALGTLELVAPLRITPIGGEARIAATRRLRQLSEQVVHDIGEGLGTAPERDKGDDRRPANGYGDGVGR